VCLIVKRIKITGLKHVGVGDGSDFSVTIQSGGQNQLETLFIDESNCQQKYNKKEDVVIVDIKNPVKILGDSKFLFYCLSKGVPRGYDDCAFFFWLHTYFVTDNRIFLTREQLDNPHKQKTWGVWSEKFSVEIIFENP